MWINWKWRKSDDEFLANSYAATKDLKVLEKMTKFEDEMAPDPLADNTSWILFNETRPLLTEFEYGLRHNMMKEDGTFTRRKPLSKEQRNVILELCSNKCTKCGSPKALDIHHKDENPGNNALGNLTVLCRDCHQVMHGKKVEVGEEE